MSINKSVLLFTKKGKKDAIVPKSINNLGLVELFTHKVLKFEANQNEVIKR